MTPCQWMELGAANRFDTRSVMASPSRHRNSGAGSRPFGRGDSRLAGEIHGQCANLQIEFSPGQDGTCIARGCRLGGCDPAKATRTAEDQHSACEPLDQTPS